MNMKKIKITESITLHFISQLDINEKESLIILSVYKIHYFLRKRKEEETISITPKNQRFCDNIARGLMRNPNLTRIPSFHRRFRKRPPTGTNIQSLRFQTAANTKAVPY